MMINRQAETAIRQASVDTATVVLLVGKTTSARHIAASWPGGTVFLIWNVLPTGCALTMTTSHLRARRGKSAAI